MSEQTLWVETPCEHGDVTPHGLGVNARIAGRIDCPGGDRHEASPSELLAAVAGLATEPDYEAALQEWLGLHGSKGQAPRANILVVQRIVDAALAGRIVLEEGSEG